MATQPNSSTPAKPLGTAAGRFQTPAAAEGLALNATWRRLLLRAEIAAPQLRVALIEGAMGTGKQTLARFLHKRSVLAKSPFRRRDTREWLATEADPAATAGFVYLDRIDLLAASGQAILLSVLRVLEDQPAGRTALVLSSHTSVDGMAREGLWMPELAIRLAAVHFALPALRERRAEIAPLVDDLLARFSAAYRQRPATLGPGVLSRLIEHDWPGNLRELASVLEAAFLATADGVIRLEDLSLLERTPEGGASRALAPSSSLALEDVIHNHVQHVLAINHGNKLKAARQLGISRSTLYRILQREPIVGG